MSRVRLVTYFILVIPLLGSFQSQAQSRTTVAVDENNKQKGKSASDAVIEAGDTKEDEEMRVQVKTAVWESQLGQMFADFLNAGDAPQETNRKAHAIVDRMFDDITLTIMRSAAVQLMIEDLFEQDRVDKNVNGRIQLFQTLLGETRHQRESKTLKKLYRRSPRFIMLAAILASPLAVEQSGLALKWAGLKAAEKTGFKVGRALSATEGQLHLRDLASRQFFQVAKANGEISPIYLYLDNGFTSFMKWFGVYSVYYFMAQSGSTDNVPIVGRVAIIGLEQSTRLRQL